MTVAPNLQFACLICVPLLSLDDAQDVDDDGGFAAYGDDRALYDQPELLR